MASLLSASILLSPIQGLAQTREVSAPRAGLTTASGGALERMLGDAGGFDRIGVQAPVSPLPAAPRIFSVREVSRRGPGEPNGWEGFARDASARREATLASLLSAIASLAPRAERGGAPSERETVQALKQAAKAQTWLWAGRALAPTAHEGDGAASLALIAFLSAGEPEAGAWVKSVGEGPWTPGRLAAARSKLPALAKAWRLPQPSAIAALVSRALSRAQALRPAAPQPEARPPAQARAKPGAPPSPALGDADPSFGAGAPAGPVAQAAGTPIAYAGNVASALTLDKLGQRSDLAGAGRGGELEALERVLRDNAALTGSGRPSAAAGPGRGAPGAVESSEYRWANLEALKRALMAPAAEEAAPEAAAKPPLAGTPQEKAIEALVQRVEGASGDAQAQLGARDAAAGMLAAADRARGGALRERRTAREMQDFRKNYSRLAMVMELSYTLNLLTSAEAAAKGMQAIMERKLNDIQAARKRSEDAERQARERQAKGEEWKRKGEESVEEDVRNMGLFEGLKTLAERFVDRVRGFQGEVSGLIDSIEARDRGQSPDAASEYRRRLALIPMLGHSASSGDSGDVTKLSLADLKAKSEEVKRYLADIAAGEGQFDAVPQEMRALAVYKVPGIPAFSVTNADAAQTLAMLAQRRAHWQRELDDARGKADSARALIDPGNTRRKLNDFGDSIPESLVVYRREAAEKLSRAQSGARRYAELMDQANSRMGAGLPMLAGLGVEQLEAVLPGYGDALDRWTPPAGADELDTMAKSLDKLSIARYLPQVADHAIPWAENQETVKVIDEVMGWLPGVASRLGDVEAGLRAVVDDVAVDEAWVNGGMNLAEGDAILARKKALVARLKSMLTGLVDVLDRVLIPYVESEERTGGHGAGPDGYEKLYKAKLDLITKTREAFDKTVPWALAGWGAPTGNPAAATAAIAKQRATFQDYRQKITDFNEEIRKRTDPDGAEMEDVYGEPMPYSLPKRIAQFREEQARRAAQVNSAAATINEILRQIDQATAGRYGLASRYTLPDSIQAGNPASKATLDGLAHSTRIQDMAAALKQVADDGQAAAGPGGLGDVAGGGTTVPTGNQPDVKLPEGQRVALLALEAIKRLVPTSSGDSFAEALARYLFADAVIDGSSKSLREQIPAFKAFLLKGASALDRVFADLDADEAFVASGGGGGASVYARKTQVFGAVATVAAEGAALFERKKGWDRDGANNVDAAVDYYAKTGEIFGNSLEAIKAEEEAALTYKASIDQMAAQWTKQKEQVAGWLKQLNDPHETAMNRIAQNLSDLQVKTRAVLETNGNYQRLKRELETAQGRLEELLRDVEGARKALARAIADVRTEDLDPRLSARIDKLTLGGPAWLSASPRGPQTLVIPKGNMASFLNTLLGTFGSDTSSRDIAQLREQLLRNPNALAQLLPNAQMLSLGDDPNGFYLVYQSNFAVPGGLETDSTVTLGNLGHIGLGDTNISAIGYRFASPPSDGNAPYGDQGVTIRAESLGGEHAVNYLDVTFHRLLQDLPKDLAPQSQAQEARMMLFDDFAFMAAGGKLYFGAVGFADMAVHDRANKPWYAGGNVKTEIQFQELMTLTAEQSQLYASDPRSFMQKVNLDFTKFDPTLNQDFVISAKGEQKEFLKRKLGTRFDLGKAVGSQQAFTLEVYGSQLQGTDDISQHAAGATLVKGFAFNLGDNTPARVTGTLNGELGEKYNSGTARVSFELPKQGVVLSAQGKMLGDADSYFIELRKRFGNAEAFLSYGSPYVGLNNRLTLGTQTSFTLGQLWRAAVGGAAQDAVGGAALKGFHDNLDKFFEREAPDGMLLGELKRVFDSDIGKRLIELELGSLSRELGELAKAGAIMDNTRMRGMIGFVSGPIGTGTADRAAGGGFQIGTQTDMTLSKTKRALVEQRTASIYQHGLKLQTRLLELAKDWQQAVSDVVQAQWELALALWSHTASNDPVLRASTRARAVEADGRLRQARLRYNLLTGRSPDDATLEAVNPRDFDQLLREIGSLLDQSDRVSRILRALDPSQLPAPEPGFNLLDWVPWIEGVTLSIGAQLQDLLANQVLGMGVTIRVPIYDPTSSRQDKALLLESTAILDEMRASYLQYRARAQAETLQAQGLEARIKLLEPESLATAKALGRGLRDHRNGLLRREGLWDAERRWRESLNALLEARARVGLAKAWAMLDQEEADSGLRLAAPAQGAGQATDLFGAVKEASAVSPSMDALAYRSQAAAQLLEASDRRFAKWGVDLFIGTNITADGIGWIPAFGLTGIGIFPIINTQLRPEELQSLERRRRGSEEQGAGWLAISLESDLAMQIVTQASAYRSAADALAVAEDELIPLRVRQAASGLPDAGHALAEARLGAEALRTARDQAQASMNFLLGRPAGAPLELARDPQALMAQLRELYAQQPPLEARRRVLELRIETARAVETIVDKNLKVQEIRVEPVSLIGRSLGRLIAALSGSGDSSPELVARARNQTLEAERELAALERGLGAARSRLSFQLAFLDAELRSLEGKTDPESRMRAAALRNRRVALQVQAAALGVDVSAPVPGAAPSTWDQLKDRLVAAVEAKVSPEGLAGVGDSDFGNEPQAQFMRWYGRLFNAFQSLGKEHIGRWFKETWIELRLRSPNTPPEGLVALAQLEEQKGDELHRAATARARAEAEMLLARFSSRANLLRWTGAYGGTEATRNGGQTVTPSREYVEALETGLRQDFAVIAAHLGLAGTVRVQDIVALVPRESASDPERSAERTRAEMDDIDFKALKRILFEDGVPDAVGSMRDGVLQLKADLIAEKMSYKGFTPVGAFGIFRDTKVGGVFLEAPDPRAIENSLREVLTDALRQELESQDRLRTLGLKLHSLMASVADNTKLLSERLATLRAARDNWAGTQIEAARGMAPASALARAQAETDRAEADFLDTLLALRLEFVELATELSALGHRSIPNTPRAPSMRPGSGLPGAAAGARERLLDYWTDRMLDKDFEAGLAQVFDGRVPTEERDALRKELELWRTLKSSAETLRASDLDPKERLDLLGRADVAGRRGAVRRRLERLLPEGGALAPASGSQRLWQYLMTDLDAQLGKALTSLDSDRSLIREMREAFWKSGPATAAAQAHFERLAALKVEAESRRDALLAAYLEARERPEDFLLRDRRLDAYLGALQAYDAGVVNAFSDVRISGDRLQGLRLNAVFSLSESAARRRDYLRHGRALLAADILVEAESARLDALRFERGPVDSIGAVSQRIAWLKAFRERLVSRPDTLPSLAAGVDASGQAQAWWTLGELSGLERAGRVVVAEGIKWVLPASLARSTLSGAEALAKAGALRLVTGVDAAQEQLQQGREAHKQAELDRKAQGLLAQSDFALIHHDGTIAALSLAELRELEAKGRVLYFDSRPDRRGLRPALHPVAARMMDPKNVLILVDRQDRRSAGRFPTLESLSASGEKDQFSLLRAGARGARALAAEETRRRDATLSGAWILLKLDGYAFSLDDAGVIQAVYMNQKELDAAREKARSAKDDDPMKTWSFHRTGDLSLGLASDGTLVEARLYGKLVFQREGLRPSRWVKGDLFGAQLDREGRLVRAYTDRGGMEREAKGWWLEDMEGNLWPGDGSVMSPAARLRRYVACEADAQRQPRRETCVPIVLGRSFLEKYLDAAEDGKKAAERWWYMPYNWPNIVLETPRGIVKTPIEMITGRDPNQSGYIGRVYGQRGEGFADDHRGPFGKVVHFFDFLEILPDPVDRYHDPSQFPKVAEGDGQPKPGRQPFEGTPQAGGKDLHLGAQGWMRRIRYAQEDIEEARGRILGAFEGGVRSQFVETVRGRAGAYPEAKVEHSSGRLAMDQALRELGFLADASGDASLSVDPGHLAVDHVEGDVQIRLGAAQHEAARKRYEAWTEELEKAASEPQPEPDLAGLDRDLRSARVDRMLARAAEAAAPEAGKAFKATAFPLAPLIARRPTR